MINNDARSYASLSSGLLARKGAARPAMRPQGFGPHHGFEDLGWNDMGQVPPPVEEGEAELPEHVPSSISALTPAPKLPKQAAEDVAEPEVVAQQRAIAESFAPDGEAAETVEPAPPPVDVLQVKPRARVVPLPKRSGTAPAAGGGRKAAFTLRLDGERHLRLRLATAVTGQSAQQIVTGALDALLASIPEVEALAARVPATKAKRS